MVFTVLPGPAIVSARLDQKLHIGHSFPFICWGLLLLFSPSRQPEEARPHSLKCAPSSQAGALWGATASCLVGKVLGAGASRPACAAGAWKPGRSSVLSRSDDHSWQPGFSRAQELMSVDDSAQWIQEDTYPESDVLAKDTLLLNVRRRISPHTPPSETWPTPTWSRGQPVKQNIISSHIPLWGHTYSADLHPHPSVVSISSICTWPFEVGSPGHSSSVWSALAGTGYLIW